MSSQDCSGLQSADGSTAEQPSLYVTPPAYNIGGDVNQSEEEKRNFDQESTENVDPHDAQEVCDYFREMLVQVQQRFTMMSDQIMKKNILSPRYRFFSVFALNMSCRFA
uniref:Uncharacterized protein n=1 Tax=Trichuris muris TaxID=70415 RepID=A0A5S6QKQ4_TRIMR